MGPLLGKQGLSNAMAYAYPDFTLLIFSTFRSKRHAVYDRANGW